MNWDFSCPLCTQFREGPGPETHNPTCDCGISLWQHSVFHPHPVDPCHNNGCTIFRQRVFIPNDEDWIQGPGGQTPQEDPPDWWAQREAQEQAEEEERRRIPDECITVTEEGYELIDLDLARDTDPS